LDSREYVFIYPIRTTDDIPADFPQEVRTSHFETGVFLPQDDSSWLTRPPRYPARVLLLEKRSLFIVPHPFSEQPPIEVRLDDLIQLETGCVLLLGWINFTTRSGVHELIYNTRASRPLETFLSLLKRRWLDKVPPLPNAHTVAYGDQLDIKFKYSSYDELDHDESVLRQYFEAPAPLQKRFLFLKRMDWRAGNLILWTSMNRLVWITDQYRQRRELYASISFSAPSSSLRSCRIEDTDGEQYIAITFGSGLRWRVPIHEAHDSSSFCEAVNRAAETAGLSSSLR
jgi:hypothetical protein